MKFLLWPCLIDNCYARYLKVQFNNQLYIDICGISLYLSVNPTGIKSKNINNFILISSIMK